MMIWWPPLAHFQYQSRENFVFIFIRCFHFLSQPLLPPSSAFSSRSKWIPTTTCALNDLLMSVIVDARRHFHTAVYAFVDSPLHLGALGFLGSRFGFYVKNAQHTVRFSEYISRSLVSDCTSMHVYLCSRRQQKLWTETADDYLCTGTPTRTCAIYARSRSYTKISILMIFIYISWYLAQTRWTHIAYMRHNLSVREHLMLSVHNAIKRTKQVVNLLYGCCNTKMDRISWYCVS